VLPLSTLGWVQAATAASGAAVPPDTPYVGYSVVYDPVGQQMLLHTNNGDGNYAPETWAFSPAVGAAPTAPPTPPPTATTLGIITAFPLPSTYAAPHSTAHGAKHTNLAYSPLNNRIYVSGGDWLGSATDGTWSMDLATGSWRQDVGAPVYPSLPAPHAAQDGMGFAWMPGRNQFVFWPGLYFSYAASTDPIRNYAKGTWFFDPASNTWTQHLNLFGSVGGWSGSLFGGIYDEVNDHLIVLNDSTYGFAARRWSVATMSQLPDLPFSLSKPAGWGNYYTRSQYARIGRYIYAMGYRTNGDRASQTPLFFRWHMDNHTAQELPAPPIAGSFLDDKEVRLGASMGKIIWPAINGPEGEINGIWVYDPATNAWAVDNQVPSYGNFIANTLTSLPDGRVVLTGGNFGRQQTHIWFYQAQ
jgi:hypothetical protein